jgi:hypothetical protein
MCWIRNVKIRELFQDFISVVKISAKKNLLNYCFVALFGIVKKVVFSVG